MVINSSSLVEKYWVTKILFECKDNFRRKKKELSNNVKFMYTDFAELLKTM